LSDARRDAAWRLMKYLSENSLDWAEGGQIPVRKSLRETDRFRAMKIQAEFAKQIPYIRYMPSVSFSFEFCTEFDAAIEKALRGSKTPKEALDTAAENIEEIIERQRAIRAKLETRARNGKTLETACPLDGTSYLRKQVSINNKKSWIPAPCPLPSQGQACRGRHAGMTRMSN